MDDTYADTKAREIASAWHGGGGSELYVLTSTGAITDKIALRHEIAECAKVDYISEDDTENLLWLVTYVYENGERGPVDGWSQLTW